MTHIAPRLVGPAAAYHSHPGLAGLGACAFAASTPTIVAKMPRPAIKARFMISSLWINNCRASKRPREANVPAMPGKKTIQTEELAACGNATRRFIRKRERTASPLCRLVTSAGNPLAHAISEREPNNQDDCNFQHSGVQPCTFFGGSLCASSGHSVSTTDRISSEI